MAGQKFTVSLVAQVKSFVKDMAKSAKAMKLVGNLNRGITKNFQQMSSSIIGGGKKFNQTVQKMKKGTDNLGKSADKNTSKFKKLFKVFAVGAGSIGLVTLSLLALRKAFRSAAIAAEIQVQAQAFANLTASFGEGSQELLKNLREASKETLNTMQIMTTASRAILLGIATDKLVDLMKIARVAAKAMGTTAAGAFSDIALGIGRQSRLILDNLGIIIRVGPAYEKFAKAIGTTASALTDFEKKQAFQNAVIEAGENIVDRAGSGLLDFQDRIAQLNVLVQEFGFKIGASVLAAFQTLVFFLEKSGLGTKLKDIFEVKLPEILFSQVERLSKALTRIDEVLESIRTKGKKQVIKEAIVNSVTDFGGIFDPDTGILGVIASSFNRFVSKTANQISGGRLKNKFPQLFDETSGESNKIIGGESITGGITGSTGGITGSTGGIAKSLGTSTLKDEFNKRLQQNLQGLLGGQQTRSSLELAVAGVKTLEGALKDTSISASDLSKEFALKMPVIEKGLKSTVLVSKKFTDQVFELKKALVGVKEEAFLESLGIRSDKQFLKNAEESISKFERVIKDPTRLKLTDPKQLLETQEKLLSDVLKNFDALSDGMKQRVLKINTFMSTIMPNDTIKRGLNQWVDDFNNTKGRITQLGKDIATNLSTGFDNFFFNTITGKITDLKSAFNSMFTSILRSLTKFMAQKATSEFLSIIGAKGRTSATPTTNTGGGSKKSILSVAKGLFGGVRKVLGFADGGITSLAGVSGSASILKQPTLAAIAEKPGSKEAVVPLDKFANLVKPTTININAIDTKSFAQFMDENKEIVLGTIMNIKGSTTMSRMNPISSGPF